MEKYLIYALFLGFVGCVGQFMILGNGDFLPVLKYLKEIGKQVIVLARGPRTAKEIRQFAGSNFRDFEYLRELLKMR